MRLDSGVAEVYSVYDAFGWWLLLIDFTAQCKLEQTQNRIVKIGRASCRERVSR